METPTRFFQQITESLQRYQVVQRQGHLCQDSSTKSLAAFCLSLHGLTITTRDVEVLRDTLAKRLPPEVPMVFRFILCKLENTLAAQSLHSYFARDLPNPVTGLEFNGTSLDFPCLSVILNACTPHLKSLTVTLDNSWEGLSGLWKCKGCQTLESLFLTTCCERLDKRNAEAAFRHFLPHTLPMLSFLRLENFHCDEQAMDLVLEGVQRATSVKHFRAIELDFDCGRNVAPGDSLTPNALVSLSRLFDSLPRHVVLGISLWGSTQLFHDATPFHVEQFVTSLECRSDLLSDFVLDRVGLQAKQAKRMIQALERFEMKSSGHPPGNDNPFVLINGSGILDDEDVFEQLIHSIPKMTGIVDLMVEDAEKTESWLVERDKRLIQALSSNSRLCSLSVRAFSKDRLLTNPNTEKQHKSITQRNKALNETVPQALDTITLQSPRGWVSELLKPSLFGCGEYSADPVYRILRHEAENIWK